MNMKLKWMSKKILNCMPDKLYLQIMYFYHFNKFINFQTPKTFNEKMQWLKIHRRDPLYTSMVDKYAVKDIVASTIGTEYVIPTLGKWDKFDDIDFNELPNQFVLKTNHDSNGIVICKDKSVFNYEQAKRKLATHLKNNAFWYGREWPYKNVRPCIFAEKYMEDARNISDSNSLLVYKFFNFNGEPKIIQSIQNDKTPDATIDYYDTDWNLLPFHQHKANSKTLLPRPETLNEMLELSTKLSKGHPFIRVDFYEVDGKIYFSEFTFFADSGMTRFYPEEWDYKLGSWLKL